MLPASTVIFVLSSMVASCYAENTKCSSEIESFKKCRETFDASRKVNQQQEKTDRETKVKQCFASSGCKTPSADGGNEVKVDSKQKQCSKDAFKKVGDLMKACIQKNLNIVLREDHDDDKRGPGGRSSDHEDFKALCSTDEQRNKTKACIKNLWAQGKSVSEGDKDKRAEERFNANCDNKRECFANMSAECQTIFNKTKSVRCDCAKSEIATKADLNQQFQSCFAGTPRPSKDGKSESFTVRFVKRACDDVAEEDKCNKPFQPHSGEKGFNRGKGNNKGGNHH